MKKLKCLLLALLAYSYCTENYADRAL